MGFRMLGPTQPHLSAKTSAGEMPNPSLLTAIAFGLVLWGELCNLLQS
jgi:hypothetical protein